MPSKKDAKTRLPANLRAPRKRKAPATPSAAATSASVVEQVPNMVPLPPADIVIRLVRDAVYSRIRHRALLEVLVDGAFDPRRYRDKFKEITHRDYRALYAKLILKEDDFGTLHGSWQDEDERFYRQFFGGHEKTIEHEETR